MSVEPEIMRSCLLEAFRRNPRTQYENLKYEVAGIVAERGAGETQAAAGSGHRLERADWRRLREGIWSLISEGVVVVGMDDSNESWPWVSLTEYGERVVASPDPIPHDPAGYIATLVSAGPMSPTEGRYVTQALESYTRGLPDAAAVMIGAASEHLLETLTETIQHADPAEAQAAAKALAGPGLGLVKFAHEYFNPRQKLLARSLREQLNTTFLGIASMIRVARNDAGHPSLATVTRDQAFVNLQLYAALRAWVMSAIEELPLGAS